MLSNCMHPPGTQGIKPFICSDHRLNHQIQFLPGLILFFSPAQRRHILPQKQKSERTASALPQTSAGHIWTQLYEKLLCCMEEQRCALETPQFSGRKDSSPHCAWEQSARTQITLQGCYYRTMRVQLQKQSNPCCLEMKCSGPFSNWLEIYTASQRYG